MKTYSYFVIALMFGAAATCLLLNLYRITLIYSGQTITIIDILSIATTAIAGHFLGNGALQALRLRRAQK